MLDHEVVAVEHPVRRPDALDYRPDALREHLGRQAGTDDLDVVIVGVVREPESKLAAVGVPQHSARLNDAAESDARAIRRRALGEAFGRGQEVDEVLADAAPEQIREDQSYDPRADDDASLPPAQNHA